MFPGGVLEADDALESWLDLSTGGDHLEQVDRAHRIAAVRETWEEAGILVAHGPINAPVAEPETPFNEVVAATGARLMLDQIIDFAHWITPEFEPRRFDTRFFITVAPDGQEAGFDGRETVSAQWISPVKALELHESGAQTLLFPTRLNMMRLAESTDTASAITAARARPRFTVRPGTTENKDGFLVGIPPEAGYGDVTGFQPR